MKLYKLEDKIKYIKKVLKTPYHFFSMTSTHQVIIIFENRNEKRFTFSGRSMYNSIEIAEQYVLSEIKTGSLEDINEEKILNNVSDKKN